MSQSFVGHTGHRISSVTPSLLLSVALSFAVAALHAAEPGTKKRAAKPKASPETEPPIAATVGDEPVFVAEVEDILASTRRAKTEGREGADPIRPLALEQAINRRLVSQYLASNGYKVDEAETSDLLEELKRKLEAQGLTFDEFLSRRGFNELIVRRRLTWDAMWASYLGNIATDKAIEEFFERRRSDYDGRELRVSHILWPVKSTDEAARVSAVIQEAEQVRSQIMSGKLSFAQAAEKHSAGPSRRQGGDLGFIPLHDRMTEAFSRAAFELKKGEISKPVVDQFGVHLIQCTDVKPGDRTWRDARRELMEAISREKFLELADKQRQAVIVKIIDAS
jgi:peptidyl-prolyl cis-trans isomerase C